MGHFARTCSRSVLRPPAEGAGADLPLLRGWTYSYGLGGPKAREAPVNLWVCSEGRGRKLGQEGGL